MVDYLERSFQLCPTILLNERAQKKSKDDDDDDDDYFIYLFFAVKTELK